MIAFSPLEQEIKPSEERRGEGGGGRRGNKLSLSVTAEFLANANTKTIPIVVVEAVTKNSFPVNNDTFQKLHRFLPISVVTLGGRAAGWTTY